MKGLLEVLKPRVPQVGARNAYAATHGDLSSHKHTQEVDNILQVTLSIL